MVQKNYKKYFNTSVATALVTSSAAILVPTATAASNFSDVQTSDYFYESVRSLAERGIIKGFPDGKFRPNQPVTRGQAAKIIAGALKLDTVNVENPGFTDVAKDDPYYGAIAALAKEGIISGYPDGTYRTSEPILRNHMAKIVANSFQLKASSNSSSPFTDVHSDYANYITALYENKITTGKTATTFDGTSHVTRGQLASFVVRAENIHTEASNEVTFTISEVKGTTLLSEDANYNIGISLQSILNSSNSVALEGSTLKAKVVDNEIVSIDTLELNVGGNEGSSVILDGNDAIFNGNLIVNADFIELKNLKVTGNVTLTGKVVNQFVATDLNVNGELIIDDSVKPVAVASLTPIAADVNNGPRVIFNNSKINKVNAKRNNVALSSDTKMDEIIVSANVVSIQIDADVTKVTVELGVKVSISGNGNIDEVTIQDAREIALQLTGTIAKLLVNDKGSKVEVATSVKITTLVVPTGTDAKDIIPNFVSISDNIGKVENSNGTWNTGNSGKGSGGKGNSSDPKDTVAPIVTVMNNTEVTIGNTIDIQSNEKGWVYLVPESTNPKTKNELDSLVISNVATKAEITAINSDINISTVGSVAGQYKVYAVDIAGNLSNPKIVTLVENIEAIVATSISFTEGFSSLKRPIPGQTTTADYVAVVFDQNNNQMNNELVSYSLLTPVIGASIDSITGRLIITDVTSADSLTVVANSGNLSVQKVVSLKDQSTEISNAFDLINGKAIDVAIGESSDKSAVLDAIKGLNTSGENNSVIEALTEDNIEIVNGIATITLKAAEGATPEVTAKVTIIELPFTATVDGKTISLTFTTMDLEITNISAHLGANNSTVASPDTTSIVEMSFAEDITTNSTIDVTVQGDEFFGHYLIYQVDAQWVVRVPSIVSDINSSVTIEPSLAEGQTSTVTITARDQYNTPLQGVQFKYDLVVTDTNTETDEGYTIDGMGYKDTTSSVSLLTLTDNNGESHIEVSLPSYVDSGDGFTLQFKNFGIPTVNIGDNITYIKQ